MFKELLDRIELIPGGDEYEKASEHFTQATQHMRNK